MLNFVVIPITVAIIGVSGVILKDMLSRGKNSFIPIANCRIYTINKRTGQPICGGTVLVDNKFMGQIGGDGWLDIIVNNPSGQHQIEVVHPKYRPIKLDFAPPILRIVEIKLEPLAITKDENNEIAK